MVKYEKLKVAIDPSTPEKEKKPKPKLLTVKAIEKLALKHESFGFGQVDAHGITTHGFDPVALRKFVRAIEAATRNQ